MRYTTEQIDKAADWFADQANDDVTCETINVEFQTLRQILIDGIDPKDWFNELMDWAKENMDDEE